jgi:DNA polymerase V
MVASLGETSNNTIVIATKAKLLLQKIFIENVKYQKVGITLLDLVSQQQEQYNLLTVDNTRKHDWLMQTLDSINARFCADKVVLAAQGTKREWQMKRQLKSQNYTTRWRELPSVK